MRLHSFLCGALMLASATFASAQITNVGSGTKIFFGSQNGTYRDSDPTGISFTPPPNGPYSPGNPLPNLPLAPTPMNYPAGYGLAFSGGAHAPTGFTDSLGPNVTTSCKSQIDDLYNPSGTLVQDAQVVFPIWRLYQDPAAPGYTFEQMNFVDDFLVTTTLAGSTPSWNILISGSVNGAWAQMDAAITYTWQDINSAGFLSGTPTTLGTISYQWSSTGGPFTTSVASTGSLLNTPSSNGILELSGYAYLAGDPMHVDIFDLSVVPEPTSMALLTIGALALLRRERPSHTA